MLATVDPGDVVEVAGSPYRVVDVEEDEDDGVLRLYDLVERAERVKAAGAGDVSMYLHRSESEAIQTRVDQERERRDDQEDDVDEGDSVETDGGFERLNAMERQAEAIEDVAEQMRIQNAALVELTRTLDKLVAVEMTDHPGDGRSGRNVAGAVEDAALDVEERVDLDAVDRVAEGDG
ncbi:hypothetical protein EI982_09405 [Haloplanus rallus]|uniref:Uncharacterized protein n=1 Tax=Haloplanus rallus TaxID=1816183 RepID=A0A6B9F9Q2_9EURY|nr:hypothetical protein [Haloplanus rallus]QGX94991.1 hypothetical protein EI982_09405 [Haloplanus rallus]